MPAPSARGPHRLTRAHAIWAIGVLAYLAAVTARTSFGVVSVEASHRFAAQGAVLSLFGVVQMGTYAAAQIPAGLLLDRWGPRRMLILGALTMAAGQVVMALAEDVPLALLARLLTGVGDAATLVSVLRLTAVWFPSRQVPLFTQLATMIGQLGQAVSAIPFFAVVLQVGWSQGFLALGALLLVTGILAVSLVRDAPAAAPAPAPAEEADGSTDRALEAYRASHEGEAAAPVAGSPVPAREILREVLTSRGAWSGLFLHCLSIAAVNSFLFLWGVPFLQRGHGLDHGAVSLLLTVNVLVMVVIGPVIGFLTGRFPERRMLLGLLAGAVVAGTWAATLAVPGTHSAVGFLPLMVGLALGSATCSVGFDLARTAVRPAAIGTASGFVNIGGFGGGLLCVLLVGLALDARTGGAGAATLEDYRVALCAPGIVLLAAAVGLIATGRRSRRHPATTS